MGASDRVIERGGVGTGGSRSPGFGQTGRVGRMDRRLGLGVAVSRQLGLAARHSEPAPIAIGAKNLVRLG